MMCGLGYCVTVNGVVRVGFTEKLTRSEGVSYRHVLGNSALERDRGASTSSLRWFCMCVSVCVWVSLVGTKFYIVCCFLFLPSLLF